MPELSADIQPVLLISHDGMLGRAWLELLNGEGIEVETVTYPNIDFTQPETIPEHVTEKYGTVINCAAYTAVDACEENEELATQINGHGVSLLAARCKQIGATLIHYSTDYVFDGEATEPYKTDQDYDPLNAYGRTKAVGETGILNAEGDHIIIRTAWLYAPWANNFVRTMAKLTRDKDSLQVVDDQRGRPTSAEHLAKTSLGLLAGGHRGIFHVCDGGECTWHEFTVEIAKQLGNTCDIQPCSSDVYQRPAKRPAYSVMDMSTTETAVGAMPDWKDNLSQVLGKLEPLD